MDLEQQQSIRRSKSRLVRPERHPTVVRKQLLSNGYKSNIPVRFQHEYDQYRNDNTTSTNTKRFKCTDADCCQHPWECCVGLITCCCWPVCLNCNSKMKSPQVQWAWREKIALVFIVVLCCALMGYLTIGVQATLCYTEYSRYPIDAAPDYDAWSVGGQWFYLEPNFMIQAHPTSMMMLYRMRLEGIHDVTGIFRDTMPRPSCEGYTVPAISCSIPGYSSNCHPASAPYSLLANTRMMLDVSLEWSQVQNTAKNKYMVYNGAVLDMESYLRVNQPFLGDAVHRAIQQNIGKDATQAMRKFPEFTTRAAKCLEELYRIGYLNNQSRGCMAAAIINSVVIVVIAALMTVRVLMAIVYAWFVAPRLAKESDKVPYLPPGMSGQYNNTRRRSSAMILGNAMMPASSKSMTSRFTVNSQPSTLAVEELQLSRLRTASVDTSNSDSIAADPFGTFVMVLVTCYSEGEEGIRNTMNSLAETDFNDKQKLVFLVADGQVKGEGNSKSTPDICLDMLNVPKWSRNAKEVSYLSIADGNRQHNVAKVYAGHYESTTSTDGKRSIPVILVVKCGTEEERRTEVKPGNRGKRDSQIILMQFLNKVMFDDRMSPLEYDIFQKINRLCGVTADRFEVLLMLDADTVVMPDSIRLMVNAMRNNLLIMGLCGETRIANKSETWITKIQVFEYFINHHLGKNFESLFGGVTCLPGCFSAYRIKAPKDNGFWIPILINSTIINAYAQNQITTLHDKNLLMLGEDRYLSTLMLKTFPKRRMIFLPQAVCKTEVPNTFKVLLSQRRRWINSTVHNLMELVLVKDLCGTFCFSMQFVVAMDLFATAVLPASIVFAVVLIVLMSVSFTRSTILPLITYIMILFLPSLLVLLATGRLGYFHYMLWYLLAAPIWNFVLPVYSFWHFDDFSWGKTRKVESEVEDSSGGHGGNDNADTQSVLDVSVIPMKRWSEWEMAKNNNRPLSFYIDSESEAGSDSGMLNNYERPRSPLSPSPITDGSITFPGRKRERLATSSRDFQINR